METRGNAFHDDDFLPDEILDRLEAALAKDCVACAVRDSGPLDDEEA
jgi:hypothetical protein